MNPYTGSIVNVETFTRELATHTQPIDPANLQPKIRRKLEETGRAQISRNSPCPCGSRKRFKRCCMRDAP